MLGRYDLFPRTVLGRVKLACQEKPEFVGRAILAALFSIGRSKHSRVTSVAGRGEREVTVSLRVRIANGRRFYNLDVRQRRLARRVLGRRSLLLDFLVIADFLYGDRGGARRLRSDQYLLRFEHKGRGALLLKIIHRKGTMRMTAGELLTRVLKRVNSELRSRGARPLRAQDVKLMAQGRPVFHDLKGPISE